MNITKVETEPQLKAWLGANAGPYALDLETTGLDQWKDTITHVVLGNTQSACVIPLSGNSLASYPWLVSSLRALPEPMILHNYKFDFKMLYRAGVDLRGKQVRDTMLMHHLDTPDSSHALDAIVQEMWHDDYKERFWAKCRNDISKATRADIIEYAGRDGVYTAKLFRVLERARGLPLCERTHRLAAALLDTEIEGVRVDIPYLTELGAYLSPLLQEARAELNLVEPAAMMSVQLDRHAEMVDKLWAPKGRKWKTLPIPEFNWDSHLMVGRLLYDKLRLPEQFKVDKKTREKRRSVGDDALEALENMHALPKKLREYAEYQKVFTAFIEGTLQRMVNGRIYPEFNINGAKTGRISHENPNLGQVPSKGEWAKVRGTYVADDEDSLIVSADYDQLEVVIAAHFSQDPNLLRIVFGGESKHDITAKALGIPRATAKTLNFGMQYLCGPGKVAEILGLPMKFDDKGFKIVPQEAKRIWAQYWRTYEKEREVIDACGKLVDAGEPIVSPWGRTRHFPIEGLQRWEVSAVKRQAYSTLIQGTGADCMHWSFFTIAETLKKQGWGRALFEVHDQGVFSVKKAHLQEACKFIEQTMVAAGKQINLSVPLKVKVEEPSERWVK